MSDTINYMCENAVRQRDHHWLFCTKLRDAGSKRPECPVALVRYCSTEMKMFNNENYKNCVLRTNKKSAEDTIKILNNTSVEPIKSTLPEPPKNMVYTVDPPPIKTPIFKPVIQPNTDSYTAISLIETVDEKPKPKRYSGVTNKIVKTESDGNSYV